MTFFYTTVHRNLPSGSSPTRPTRLFCLSGILALLIAAGSQGLSPAAPAAPADALIQQERIVAQVEPLCWSLLPEHATLNFVVSPVTACPTSAPPAMWTVDCTDAHGRPVLYMLWDAATRRPFSLSSLDKAGPSLPAPLADPQQAIATARRWAVRIRVLTRQEAYNAPVKTQYQQGVWSVGLRGPQCLLLLFVSARTGRLMHAVTSVQSAERRAAVRASLLARRCALSVLPPKLCPL